MTANRPYRILLIDDQEAIHQDYRKILGVQDGTAAVSKAAAELFGDDPAEVVDWQGFELDSAFQGEQGYELIKRSIEEGRPYALAFVDVRMPPGWDGVETVRRIWEIDPEILIVMCSAYSDYTWEETIRRLGRNDRFLILKKPFENIEVRQCAMAMTERWSVSRTDMLTGLLNRRAFQGHLNLEWARSQRYRYPIACAIVDLDLFKRINDTLGHQAGDAVLRTVAQVLQDNCRSSDSVCRYGGEELCVMLPHTTERGAVAWAENARHAIENTSVVIGDQVVQVTASFGVSELIDGTDNFEAMVDRADQALLVAKKLGRNRVVSFASVGDAEPGTLEQVRQHNLFDGVIARQVMTSPVSCLPLETTAGAAAEFFLQFRLNSAPVVDENGTLAGILSEKDVIAILLRHDAWTTPINRIIQRNVICYEETAPVADICEFLSRVAVRRVVIVRDGCPTGVVSRGSLLRWYSNWINTHYLTPEEVADAPAREIRGRIVQGAQALARCAVDLSETLSGPVDDLVPPVIEGVSKLQELISDLLGCSHASSLQGLPLDNSARTMADC